MPGIVQSGLGTTPPRPSAALGRCLANYTRPFHRLQKIPRFLTPSLVSSSARLVLFTTYTWPLFRMLLTSGGQEVWRLTELILICINNSLSEPPTRTKALCVARKTNSRLTNTRRTVRYGVNRVHAFQ